MKIGFWFLIFSSFAVVGPGQTNLVPNPGFEEHSECPSLLSQFNGIVKNWITPTQGTPNYYHVCANHPEVGVPNNYFGNKPAFQGEAYAGIMTSNAFREYITVELKSALKVGKTYHISFFTSIIPNSNCRSTGLDILLTAQAPYNDLPGGNIEIKPTLSIPIKYTDGSWIHTEVCFQAKAGDKFLTIGDLQYPVAHHSCKEGETSYYFIDEVTIEEIVIDPPETIQVYTCPDQFPILLDASAFTTINTTSETEWTWEDQVHDRFLTVNKAGNYRLRLKYLNCNEQQFIIQLDDQNCAYSIFIPNIFTPNGDGKNDVFEIKTKGIEVQKLMIYNRIGELVYNATAMDIRWDGLSANKELPNDVYVYVIQYKIISTDKWITKSGSITLIK